MLKLMMHFEEQTTIFWSLLHFQILAFYPLEIYPLRLWLLPLKLRSSMMMTEVVVVVEVEGVV